MSTQPSKLLEELRDTQIAYGLLDSSSAFDELKILLDSPTVRGQESDDTTNRVLRVYETALSQRNANLIIAFASVRNYIDSVNDFLNGKRLVTASTPEIDPTLRLHVLHHDGTFSELDTLSSGERQIAGLIYSASHIAKGNIILVDEPELSLHIDWQRTIIGAMVQQLPSKQLIVCTHSPVIGSQYGDQMTELTPKPTSVKILSPEVDVGDEIFFADADYFGELE